MDESKDALMISGADIKERIFTIRGQQVMIDRDLAMIYSVSTKRLNEQVKRNLGRFPPGFRFPLSDVEKYELVEKCDRLKSLKHSSVNPCAITEQLIAMLSAVLRSETAIKVRMSVFTFITFIKKVSCFQRQLSRNT